MALATTHPSGYDGDYLTSDLGVISRKGGNNKTVVSLRLVPIGSVIRVFPFTENEEKFVRFKHSELSPCADLNFTYLCCLHECNGKVCQVSMKMSKDEKNSGLGGGTNIATLISHGRTHFTKIQSMTGQKSLLGYLNVAKKSATKEVSDGDNIANTSSSTRTTTNESAIAFEYSVARHTSMLIQPSQRKDSEWWEARKMHTACPGIHYSSIGVNIPIHYNFTLHYPKDMHDPARGRKNNWIYDSEGFFRSLRCKKIVIRDCEGGSRDLNFSVLGLKNRMGDAATIAQIYAEHPEWYTLSRKLSNSFDRKNVRSWKGDTDVRHVDEALCWKNGCIAATDILRASGLFSPAELNYNGFEVNIDMLRPRGETIGVQAGDNVDASDDDVPE